MFKIGVGPSSSHTLGPWRAAQRCLRELTAPLDEVRRLDVRLYGSLAKTGRGHGTDFAILAGLMGADPVTCDVAAVRAAIAALRQDHRLRLAGPHVIDFDPARDLRFLSDQSLPFHPNGLTFDVALRSGARQTFTYYSIGGGFIVCEGETPGGAAAVRLPCPIDTANDLLHWCDETGLSVSDVVWKNEACWRSDADTRNGLARIWQTMRECVYRGCHTEGELPGGLRVTRRAPALNRRLLNGRPYADYDTWLDAIRAGGDEFSYILDWVSGFALAVNEENACFGRVVTAPTNGAAGVIPAVLQYHVAFDRAGEDAVYRFLLTASEIGCIFKKGATISAAMGGCQAEIGVSSAMAAAALAECRGGSPRQVLMAAEIAMEHHLGLTCDPIGGLVQIPCIERNTMGAIKAITAAQLALQGNPADARVPLDTVVKTMWQTAQDMSAKYKETSDGGLVVQVSVGLSEC